MLPDIKKLRVLNLEDNPNDSELIQAELETAWDEVELLRAETRDAFAMALDEFKPDVVLSDFKLPGMDGREALNLVRHTHPDIPVIMVTGVLADIEAVELVKLGAKDYVMKDHMQRLTSAVQAALSQEQGVRARKAAEQALRQSEEEIRELVERSPIAMVVDAGADERVAMMNRRFTELFGYTIEDIPDITHWWPLAYPDQAYREQIQSEWGKVTEKAIRNLGETEPMETSVTCKDGSVRYVRISFASIGSRNIVTFEDLTERRRAEGRIERLNQLYEALSQCNQAIVRSVSETELFSHICQSIVRFGGFRMAWIGLFDPATKMVVPAVSCGEGAEAYLRDAKIPVDAAGEYGPTGMAMRDDQPFWCQDFLNSPFAASWHGHAVASGWRSCAALPLHRDGAVVGAFNLYSSTENAFDLDVRRLLTEMSADISYALDNFSHEAQRKLAEEALENSRNLLKTVIDASPMRIFWKDRELRYLGCNPAFARDAGERFPEDLIGKDDYQLAWKELAELYRTDDRQVMDSGVARISYDEPQISPDEKVIWLRTSKVPLRNFANEVIGVLGIYEDITERKLTELALQRSEADLKRAQAVAQVGSWKLDIRANRFEWSEECHRIFGIPKREAVDMEAFAATLHPDDREGVLKAWNEAVAGAPYDIEHRIVVNGETRWVRERAIVEWGAEGHPLFGIGTTQDITERKQAEDMLRKLSLAVEQSPSSIVITDLDARLEYVNEAFVRTTGYSRAEAIGQNPRILHCGKTPRETYDDMWSHLTRGEIWRGELVNCRKDGSEYVESMLISPVRDAAGRATHYLAIKEDITERKQIEAQMVEQYRHVTAVNAQLVAANQEIELAKHQLLQSEKMAAIGLLAAGVAHEINNPVGYVNSNLGTLEKYLADIFVALDKYEAAEALLETDNPLLDEVRQFKARIDFNYLRADIKSLIAESHQGLERIKKIIIDLKDFSRTDVEEQWVWADVHHGLDTTLNVVWNELKYKCEVVKEYGDLPDIYCLPSQLNQVFMNLLVNAAQAIEVRGKITIRTGAEGERVWVEVSDTGHGIPPEIIPRLFDPFFTTKPVGKGTGLGLSVSYNIVEKHRGKIEVDSEPGKGTTFRVWLPVRQPEGNGNNA